MYVSDLFRSQRSSYLSRWGHQKTIFQLMENHLVLLSCQLWVGMWPIRCDWLALNVLKCYQCECALVIVARKVSWSHGHLYSQKMTSTFPGSLLVQYKGGILFSGHTGSVNKFEEYKKQKYIITTAIHHAKSSFLNQLHQANSKTFWRVIKSPSKPSSIPNL